MIGYLVGSYKLRLIPKLSELIETNYPGQISFHFGNLSANPLEAASPFRVTDKESRFSYDGIIKSSAPSDRPTHSFTMTARGITWLLVSAMALSCLLEGSRAGEPDYCKLCAKGVQHIACGNNEVSGWTCAAVVAVVHLWLLLAEFLRGVPGGREAPGDWGGCPAGRCRGAQRGARAVGQRKGACQGEGLPHGYRQMGRRAGAAGRIECEAVLHGARCMS